MGQAVGYAANRDDSYVYTDGVVTVEVTSADKALTDNSVFARKGSVTAKEISGGAFAGISASDTVWVVWPTTSTAPVEVEGSIRVGAVAYHILSVLETADLSMKRCICRLEL